MACFVAMGIFFKRFKVDMKTSRLVIYSVKASELCIDSSISEIIKAEDTSMLDMLCIAAANANNTLNKCTTLLLHAYKRNMLL